MTFDTTSDTRIDILDYAILETVAEPLWKTRIHAELADRDDFPVDDIPAPQTISRRVDSLATDGYVTTTIVAPDGSDRELLIGYMRTQAGDEAVAEK